MLENIKNASTYMLHSDKRVDLKKEAYNFAKDIFNKHGIDVVKEDLVYFENIKISDCRDIVSMAAESSYKSCKVFILNMYGIRNEASNALLKIIEEPPKNTYFILFTTDLNIPQTILSRCIKIYIKPDGSEIDKKIYELFDANLSYIEEYMKAPFDITEYAVNTKDEAIESIKEFMKKENMYTKLKYEYTIEFLVSKAKYLEQVGKLDLIQEICDIYSNLRDEARAFLSKVLLKIGLSLSTKKYEYLVNLKNSIKNNVSTKYVIYIFFNVLYEEVQIV